MNSFAQKKGRALLTHTRVSLSPTSTLLRARIVILLIFSIATSQSWFAIGADSVAESPWFGLNLDSRASIVDTAPVEYVIWLTEFFATEDLFNLQLVAEDADPDNDGEINRLEYFADLDPTDNDDRFRFSFGGVENRVLTISPLREGVNFTILRSLDLESWLVLDPAFYRTFGENAQVDLPIPPESVFYRLQLDEPDLSL